ncbi:hypothetical protein OK016_29930 [Vibrio chagasii]|nr:hypothetical protein [Vibrio chagasii]
MTWTSLSFHGRNQVGAQTLLHHKRVRWFYNNAKGTDGKRLKVHLSLLSSTPNAKNTAKQSMFTGYIQSAQPQCF